MGAGKSVFTPQELEDYEDLTYFTKKEVLSYFHQFKALAPDLISVQRDARLPMEVILRYPQLRYNPFGDRICMVFSSSRDGDCNFEDFLDMMSVFSAEAPVSVKAEYAFRIFDFDGDDMIGPEDVEEIIRRLLGDVQFPQVDILQLVQNLTSEADLDDDGMLSFAEFEHAISKSEDFMR
ncbi:Calcium and integrin-binding protein 1 [Orchesella cincta]|uniref:Calcium and integrin-binding protein 1 n=1 Tax=Orchesella cincta TaxID=48709 RepID=A0A1D2MV49_ORCCI|nr:Calcium and integrin-binding protein 1 [Orchesella cincta]